MAFTERTRGWNGELGNTEAWNYFFSSGFFSSGLASFLA
jgi:hypothetical protein